MRYTLIIAAFVAAWASLSQPAAAAADAYTTASLNVRAGPYGAYPVIGRLPVHTPVDIRGCTKGMKWCDVSVRGLRGWVAGNLLNASYRNRQSSVIQLGSLLGLPIISFNERTYWSTNYYDRDFYKTRYGWNDDHYRYGWTRSNGHWVHARNWKDMDYDHDGISNRHDRDDDNDGIRDHHDRDDDNDGISDRYDRDDHHYGSSGSSHHRYNN